MTDPDDLTMDTCDLACRIFHIANTLQTMAAALPDDKEGCEVPTRCMVSFLARMTEEIAEEVMDYPPTMVPKKEAR
ncbi:hypothetical protein V8Z80_04840 [Orrella sp. JC864]|uniref:hypothetical protein n=1 Tax=Orrella sp. JC864 TaxID=3120298 RepID=UPI00300852D2